MPPGTSAAILLFRRRDDELEVLLVHPGGPYWASKDLGAWSLPKGEIGDGEEPRTAAIREFHEETGFTVDGELNELAPLRQPSGKWVLAWAVAGDADPASLRSNTFELEWPPKSGRMRRFPEVDRAAWFRLDEARRRILAGQVGFLDQLTGLRG